MGITIIVITVLICFGLPLLVTRKSALSKVPVFQIVLGVLLLAAFFLPWINANSLLTNFSLSGYEIPSTFKAVYNLELARTESSGSELINLLYLVFLIPISSIAVIFFGFYRRRSIIAVCTIGTITSLLAILVVALKNNEETELHLDIGFYLTVIAGILLWLSSLFNSNSDNVEEEINTTISNASYQSENNEDIYSQLLKLQALKEKNVIDDETFEKERTKLLTQLNRE